jgi:Uncharacterised nucleotidyltransferase
MKWRGRANKNVVEAVVAAFHDSSEESSYRLPALKATDWQQSYHWLDASGMALYFLDKVASLRIESALPPATLERLRRNLADNRDRSATMFGEFTSLNQSFQAAGLVYANLKGFSLSPESCPRPELRCQLDFDFLIDGNQLHLCQEILRQSGYELAVANPDVWEFKAGSSELTSIKDHYKARPQRCVELHFASSQAPPHLPFRDPRLERRIDHSWGDVTFPALAPADQFIAQALHIFKHLCSACTRLSWLLEYQHHVTIRYHDQAFWNEVREHAWTQRHASIAIGLTTLLSCRLFGGEAPPQLDEWTERLPSSVRLWADQYGRESILADFPGTKLYLLLQEQLRANDDSWKQTRRRSLLPLHRAPRIVNISNRDNARKRIRNEVYQLRFILFRLRFHVVEGLRYLVEASRWKRRLATLREFKPDLLVD